jgi:hypothetical protein
MTFTQQLDYYGKLTAQFPTPELRVVYAASGTLPAVAVLRNSASLVEHALYWMPVESDAEAHYLSAVLNSETTRSRIANQQARGQWGARHFDRVMLSPHP